jgi:hypothetical protein
MQTVNGFPSHSSRKKVYPPVLMSSEPVFRCFNQRFACARLSNLHLTYLLRLLTETFTTTPFERSRFRQFEASSHKAAPMDLPSSLIQHRVSQPVLDTITWTGHRLLPDFRLGKGTRLPLLTSFREFSICRQRFICIYLYKSHLTNLVRLFLRRSRPISFDFSRLRQFVISSYQPIPRGPPSSLLRHGYFITKVSVVSQAESARGLAPRAAHRTVRESLDSYGSCHP